MSRLNPEGANFTHGIRSSYAAYGCRCEPCTKANRDAVKLAIKARTAQPKDPNDPRHGTRSFYINHGCRCEPCKRVHSAACAAYDKRRKGQA